jgi:3-deoxy-D-manno-octulosonic-acid transferase
MDARAALPEGDVLIVDAMGELLDAYAVADVVVVGGGFGNGVHNTLEPAAHGKRVLVGPEVGRFAEVAVLEATGALSVCHSPSALREAIQVALLDVEASRRAGSKAAAYARENAGAGMAIARGWTEAL